MVRAIVCASAMLTVPLSSLGRAQPDDDYYLSIPYSNAIYRLDLETGALALFVDHLLMPFYGEWLEGHLYLPDRLLGVVLKIDAQGNSTLLSSGGLLTSPVTLAFDSAGDLFASDYWTHRIVRIDRSSGAQSLFADAQSGLLNGPGGIAFAPDGFLYVGNYIANTIVRFDPSGNGELFFDGAGHLQQPGGLRVDGCGNLFVANFLDNDILRVRISDRVPSRFAESDLMRSPDDLKLSHHGGLITVTSETSAMFRINARGETLILHRDESLGGWFGVASPADHPHCSGSMTPYGAGTAGSGGVVPELRGIFSPCPGAEVGIELDEALGGAGGFLLWGISADQSAAFGGTLLVSLSPPFGFLPVFHPGSGAGGGRLVALLDIPADNALVGAEIYFQDLVLDPGAVKGVAMSNGLHVVIGQ